MATNRRIAQKKEKMKPVEIYEGWFLWYRENEYQHFGLEHNGAVIFGCRLATTRDGGIFVAFPSRKGNDGKWYSHAMFREIPDEVIEAIADAIEF